MERARRAGQPSGHIEDHRICETNNAADRVLRGIALGRKSWLFAGSDRGGERVAVMLTLITPPSSSVDPQPCSPTCSPDYNIHRLDRLLPWNWKTQPARVAA
jgi:hypothetical protein